MLKSGQRLLLWFGSRGESADPLVCLPHVVQHHWGGDGQEGQAQKWNIPMWRYPAQQELHDENLVPFLKIMLFMVFVRIMMIVFNTKYQIPNSHNEQGMGCDRSTVCLR